MINNIDTSDHNHIVMIIGLAGKRMVGKSTAAAHLEKHGFKKLSFASPLKAAVSNIFGWTDECYNPSKKEQKTNWGITPREAMQIIGTDVFREQLPKLFPSIKMSRSSIWIERMVREIEKTEGKLIVIDDVRFDDECK